MKIYMRKIIFPTRTQYSIHKFSIQSAIMGGEEKKFSTFFFSGVFFTEFFNCWIMDNRCELWTIVNQQIWLSSHSNSLVFVEFCFVEDFRFRLWRLCRIQCHTSDVMEEENLMRKFYRLHEEMKKLFSRRFQQQKFFTDSNFNLNRTIFHTLMNAKLELNFQLI